LSTSGANGRIKGLDGRRKKNVATDVNIVYSTNLRVKSGPESVEMTREIYHHVSQILLSFDFHDS
jgi:hypothetical protein